jgi:hypothetical protein
LASSSAIVAGAVAAGAGVATGKGDEGVSANAGDAWTTAAVTAPVAATVSRPRRLISVDGRGMWIFLLLNECDPQYISVAKDESSTNSRSSRPLRFHIRP